MNDYKTLLELVEKYNKEAIRVFKKLQRADQKAKTGNAQYDVKLFVEYYDAEFCINSLFICDTIEQVKTDD